MKKSHRSFLLLLMLISCEALASTNDVLNPVSKCELPVAAIENVGKTFIEAQTELWTHGIRIEKKRAALDRILKILGSSLSLAASELFRGEFCDSMIQNVSKLPEELISDFAKLKTVAWGAAEQALLRRALVLRLNSEGDPTGEPSAILRRVLLDSNMVHSPDDFSEIRAQQRAFLFEAFAQQKLLPSVERQISKNLVELARGFDRDESRTQAQTQLRKLLHQINPLLAIPGASEAPLKRVHPNEMAIELIFREVTAAFEAALILEEQKFLPNHTGTRTHLYVSYGTEVFEELHGKSLKIEPKEPLQAAREISGRLNVVTLQWTYLKIIETVFTELLLNKSRIHLAGYLDWRHFMEIRTSILLIGSWPWLGQSTSKELQDALAHRILAH